MSAWKAAPDEAHRAAAIHARGVNVVADAGAGTGKTTLVVRRLVELVAPSDDAFPAVPLSRVAAITFTRRAAGELKLRVREALLRGLASSGLTPVRRERLAAALGALDTAHVGTIHSFADRLLRLRPVEAWLSPSYAIVEDEGELVREAYGAFLQACETGRLAAELAGAAPPAVAEEAQRTVLDALRAGLRAGTLEYEYAEKAGLDRLFERLVRTRDVPPVVAPPVPPDLARFRALVDELGGYLEGSGGEGAGTKHLAFALRRLRRLAREDDPAKILGELVRIVRARPRQMRKGVEFAGDDAGWRAWKAYDGDGRGDPARAAPLRDDLLRPFARWMARRLVATAPAVVAMYEQVKARRRAVDTIDLLLVLRDLLRDRRDVRREYQALFDHVFVDEFQDTDPLQAEIVLYLCEDGASAASWRDVRLAPGKLTIVGDPKQSIYRFRRADIAAYAAVRDIVLRGHPVVAKLTTSFRSHPSLVEWLNGRFDDLLGAAGEGPSFDPAAGTVANEHLEAGRGGDGRPRVLVVPLAAAPPRKPAYRAAEARAIAAWLRRTVELRERTIVDPTTGAARPAGYGDVAVLAPSTFNLPLLFPELDRLGVPSAARGGSLFLSDPLHRRFLLALRAIADRDDGVAQAALLEAPFFALDYDDLARERAADAGSTDPGVARARAALALVRELRARRHARPPGATARDLLERTAFGRAVALGPNGAQRLDAVRELCLALDALAAGEGLDFDGATARLRGWAVDPVQLDPPRPVGRDAVQVLTVHQAKGLEFPVVILWDACADLAARDASEAYSIGAGGTSWSLALDGLRCEEPEGEEVAARERRYLEAERKRLVYVAATRARDLLVLPVAGDPSPAWISGRLAGGGPEQLVETLAPYAEDAEPAWATEVPPPAPRPRGDASALAARSGAAWSAAVAEAARPRLAPTSVTAEAHAQDDAAEDEAGARPRRPGRLGRVFGETVHRAIGLALATPALAPEEAVARAARATGLSADRAEAAADVRRALSALERAGLRRAPGPDLRLEYPLAVARDGRLVVGYVDLLGARAGRLAVVDFKTDAPPAADVLASHPAYVGQVRSYARLVEALGLAPEGSVEAGLLFTAESDVRWV